MLVFLLSLVWGWRTVMFQFSGVHSECQDQSKISVLFAGGFLYHKKQSMFGLISFSSITWRRHMLLSLPCVRVCKLIPEALIFPARVVVFLRFSLNIRKMYTPAREKAGRVRCNVLWLSCDSACPIPQRSLRQRRVGLQQGENRL